MRLTTLFGWLNTERVYSLVSRSIRPLPRVPAARALKQAFLQDGNFLLIATKKEDQLEN